VSRLSNTPQKIERPDVRAAAQLSAAWHGDRFNGEVARLAT
jgi:hypothetical protein